MPRQQAGRQKTLDRMRDTRCESEINPWKIAFRLKLGGWSRASGSALRVAERYDGRTRAAMQTLCWWAVPSDGAIVCVATHS
jgi:hypothetical protein